VPRSASTMWVFLDGIPVGHPTYDQCRGANAPNPPGNAVGACDDDVSTLFPGYTNITQGKGAIGSYVIDTSTLSNGLHTIAWSVTDDQGRIEGIGSRFFTVFNASGDAPATTAASVAAPAAASMAAPAGASMVASMTASMAASLDAAAAQDVMAPEQLLVRRGYDPATPFAAVEPGSEGRYAITLAELERVEVQLPGRACTGGALVGGQTQSLPVGSTLDAAQGRFYWQLAAGFLGGYDLEFQCETVAGPQTVPVRITVVAKDKAGKD